MFLTIARIGFNILVLSCIYLFFGPPANEETDFVNVLLFLFFIPLIIIPATIVLSLVMEILLTQIHGVKKILERYPWLPVFALIFGIALCFVSRIPFFLEDYNTYVGEDAVVVKASNTPILICAWFITSFSIMFFQPDEFAAYIQKRIYGEDDKSAWD